MQRGQFWPKLSPSRSIRLILETHPGSGRVGPLTGGLRLQGRPGMTRADCSCRASLSPDALHCRLTRSISLVHLLGKDLEGHRWVSIVGIFVFHDKCCPLLFSNIIWLGEGRPKSGIGTMYLVPCAPSHFPPAIYLHGSHYRAELSTLPYLPCAPWAGIDPPG